MMLQLTGPRSLSSITRVGLDLARVVVGISLVVLPLLALLLIGALALALSGAAVAPDFLRGLLAGLEEIEPNLNGVVALTAIIGIMLTGAGYLVALLFILSALRGLFASLSRGEVFERRNGRRLRLVGFGLLALEAVSWIASVLAPFVGDGGPWTPPLNPTGWFSIAVVFVLAEVFREGARLRRQSELTI